LAMAGVCVYNFVTGENILFIWWRAFEVRRADLATLDRKASGASHSDIIVSLTTTPSRISTLQLTLKSLLLQSRLPREIRLNLPHVSIRERVSYDIPTWLSELTSVHIIRCEDIGPATKFLPTLLAAQDYQPVVVVDDDRIYPSCLIETLEKAATQNSQVALATCGWVVPGDLIDRPTDFSRLMPKPSAPILGTTIRNWRPVDILKGVGGYLIRPCFFNLEQLSNTSSAPTEAFYADDIWLSGHCKVDKYVIPIRQCDFAPKWLQGHFKATSLGRLDEDKRRNTATLAYFEPQTWRVGGPLNVS